jgi:hypothetical protein
LGFFFWFLVFAPKSSPSFLVHVFNFLGVVASFFFLFFEELQVIASGLNRMLNIKVMLTKEAIKRDQILIDLKYQD